MGVGVCVEFHGIPWNSVRAHRVSVRASRACPYVSAIVCACVPLALGFSSCVRARVCWPALCERKTRVR